MRGTCPDRRNVVCLSMTQTTQKQDALIISVRNPMTQADRPESLRLFTDQQMLTLKTAFVEDTLCTCAQIAGVDLKVAIAPPARAKIVKKALKNLAARFPRRKTMTTLAERVEILTQDVAPYEERLRETISYVFDEGYQRVLLIGGYNPTIMKDTLTMAFRQLRNHPIIIGPTIRGGLYLLGLETNRPDILEDVPLSSDRAYATLIEQLKQQNLQWQEMELWYDVRHQEDIDFIVRDINQFRLTGDENTASATEAVLVKYSDEEVEEIA